MKKVKHIRTGAEFTVKDFGKKIVHLKCIDKGRHPAIRVGDVVTTSIAAMRVNYSANFVY